MQKNFRKVVNFIEIFLPNWSVEIHCGQIFFSIKNIYIEGFPHNRPDKIWFIHSFSPHAVKTLENCSHIHFAWKSYKINSRWATAKSEANMDFMCFDKHTEWWNIETYCNWGELWVVSRRFFFNLLVEHIWKKIMKESNWATKWRHNSSHPQPPILCEQDRLSIKRTKADKGSDALNIKNKLYSY